MYLKRIELTGFKSFSAKTRISFEPGVSCIVGPNGSGKSNIADALRWVLGEGSARQIRGAKMEDVIFSGSGRRRPLGMAEVSVTFDNGDGYLPLPFSEISVARRAVRGGDSEYLINDAPCRLKDIRDLFVDTGIGVDGLSLINQGRIQELISARPEERRALVEEAAGIVRYRDRKREALRKLEETERHLERLGDILGELASRVEPLREQAAKAASYLALREEADNLEIGISVKVLSEAAEKIAELDAGLAQSAALLLTEESERLAAAAEAEQLRLTLSALDEEARTAGEDYYRLQTSRERAEGEQKTSAARLEAGLAARERLERELAQLEQQLAEKRGAAEALRAQSAATERQLAETALLLASGADGGGDLLSKAAALEERLSVAARQSATLAAQLAAAEKSQEFRAGATEKNRAAREQLLAEADGLSVELSGAEEQGRALERQAAEIAAASRGLSARLNENEAEQRRLSGAAQELAAEEADCRFRCHSAETRLAMLEEMSGSYEGFFPGVKGLLAAKKQGKAGRGVIGVIAELMEAPEQFRVAIEAYLGANLQNIVCEDAQAAREAVAYLKKNNLGRATFLPLDILQVRAGQDFAVARKLKGVYGRASELVQAEARLRPAVDFLLNNVLIVENMDCALAAAKALQYRAHVATLDGDLVTPGAAISGGSRGNKAGELLGKKARLEEAQRELAALRLTQMESSTALEQARAASARAGEAGEALRAQLHELSSRLQEIAREREQSAYRADLLGRRAAELAKERERLEGELAAGEEEAGEAEEECARLREQLRRLAAETDALQLDLAAVAEQVAASREELTEKKVAQAGAEQKLRGELLSLEQLAAELDTLAWDAEEKAADLALAEREAARYREATEAAEALLRQMGRELIAAGERMETARHGLAAENARLQELEKTEKERLRAEEKLRNEAHQLELRRERWQADFANEEAKLAEKFALDLARAKARVGETAARAVMSARLNQARREIEALGNVNVDAIAEYREVSERCAFLTAQREDMLTAKARLHTVIADMDKIMASRFRETFEQLSAAFDRSFRRLFDGGHAALYLSEPEDILLTGVEISVNPPGKKVANYSLLSGGEKALVGIALLFAVLAVRPTPVCLMDEVDAALDEANIDRFTAFLREQTAASQFVMISHRQSTMEAANVLWGVTMEEEGVSKVISVRLTESA